MSQVNQGFTPMVHAQAKAGRAHHLILGRSPTFYLSQLSPPMVVGLRSDQKEPPGKATAVNHAILVDEDTGALYGELYVRATQFDLIGFFGRAWANKNSPSLSGVPFGLSLGDGVTRTPYLLAQAQQVMKALRIEQIEPAFGFSIKTVARQHYEKRVWAFLDRADGAPGQIRSRHITNIQAHSAEFSTGACLAGQDAIDAHFGLTLSDQNVRKLDQLSVRGSAWRTGIFNYVSVDVPTGEAKPEIRVPLMPSGNVTFQMPPRTDRTVFSGLDIVKSGKKPSQPTSPSASSPQATLDLTPSDAKLGLVTDDGLTLYEFLDQKFQLTQHALAISKMSSLQWLVSTYGEPMVRYAIEIAAKHYLSRTNSFGDIGKTRHAFEKITGICLNRVRRQQGGGLGVVSAPVQKPVEPPHPVVPEPAKVVPVAQAAPSDKSEAKSPQILLLDLQLPPKPAKAATTLKPVEQAAAPLNPPKATPPQAPASISERIVATMERRMMECDGYFMRAAAVKLVQEGLDVGMMPEELMGLAEGAPGENWVSWRTEYIRLRSVFDAQPAPMGLGSAGILGRRWAN